MLQKVNMALKMPVPQTNNTHKGKLIKLSRSQGPQSYFENGGADKWLKVVGLNNLFLEFSKKW